MVNVICERRTAISRQLGRELGCSNSTANIMRHILKFCAQGRVSRPPLSALNMEKRLQFCQEHPNARLHTGFLDEKWWHTFRDSKKIYRRSTSPHIYEHPPCHVPKAMLNAVISRDAPGGKVGFWPVAEQRQYVRNSRYHQRGDPYWRNLSCDGAFFCRTLDVDILPACEEHGIRILQMDNARPHIVNNLDASIAEVMARHPTVQLLLQPPQSPDLNPLDEGIFKVLADKVELKNPTTRHELHEAVLQSWEELSERKIRGCIQHQIRVRRQIVDCRGGNRFV
ncbi:Hypothetical predicted protein [Octopus vulgaris]|uniref:Uncharacterized protein n=1 Tax=Octopus vulgaris TaxID=6645 RepID=A0AA36B4Z7_OCTVU|nr:Hypothetical predicted protein [Octopus vulgaris]